MSQAFLDFEKKDRRQERIGQIIVTVIAILNLFAPIFNIITDFKLSTLLSLVVAAALSAGLLCGVSWVRYLFAVCAGISAMQILFLLIGGAVEFTGDHIWLIFLLILQFVYFIATCLLLFFSKPVKEFLYRRKNG